ncbi:MAG: PH domain-containing protein [Sandaracinaceae bacterium]|nr:PH domain-containing protein [Sandaracinaceae bacterium]
MNCPSCGAKNDAAARFCSSCGATIGSASGSGPALDERVLFEGPPAAIGTIGAALVTFLTLGLAALYFWIRAKNTHYKVTTRRVVVERGIFSKRLEQIDLYRVVDYVVERPFSQRLLGTGNLILETTDRTSKELKIERVRADVRQLYEQLREATEADKRARNVRVMDVE